MPQNRRAAGSHRLDATAAEKWVYVTRGNELLQEIARIYGVTASDLIHANTGIRNVYSPPPGTALIIPLDKASEVFTARLGQHIQDERRKRLIRWSTLPRGQVAGAKVGQPKQPQAKENGMRLSEAGFQFIKGHEALRLKMYDNDGSKTGNCTIGYGHLLHRGKCTAADRAKYPNGITEAEAEQFLRQDVVTAENDVKSRVTVPLTQTQFDALVSFAFNMGGPKFGASSVLRVLNERRYDAVPDELATYSKGGGGIAVRRKEEGELFSRK